MATLKEYENQVKLYMTEENWTEAYKICTKILSYDPENTTFIRLSHKIENEVKKHNLKAIQYDLQQLDHFLTEHNYEEYLRKIAPLQIYVKDYPEIANKIVGAKKLLDQQYEAKRNQAFHEISEEIKQKGDSLDYQITLQKLDNLYKLDIRKSEVKNLQKTVRGSYIRQQLQLNKGLLESNRFEDIIIFLLKLKKIDPENRDVKKVIDRIKSVYQYYKIENKKDFIFKTIEEIKTLYITRKYELCLELCERVLQIDPTNAVALKFSAKASKKADRQSMKKIFTDIHENFKKFPQSKDFKEKNYIRI